jgi:hypothetical protein
MLICGFRWYIDSLGGEEEVSMFGRVDLGVENWETGAKRVEFGTKLETPTFDGFHNIIMVLKLLLRRQ